MLFFWTDLDENSFFVLTALQGIKSLWSRTQANRRSHLAILASTSFYGDRMKEQALDKPADRFLQFWLHLHTFGCETINWWSTQTQNKTVVSSAAESSGIDLDQQGKQKVWLLMILRLDVRLQFTPKTTYSETLQKTSVPLQEMKYWLSCYAFTTLSCHVMLII